MTKTNIGIIWCQMLEDMIEGSLNSKLPTIWRVEKEMKSRWDEVKSEESKVKRWSRVRRKKMQLRESQKKEDTSAPNVRGVAKRCVFPMIRVSGESKSRLVKAAGAESFGQRRNQKLHAAVARSTFSSENVQNTTFSDHFLKLNVQKLHAAVARRTCSSENVQNISVSDHF